MKANTYILNLFGHSKLNPKFMNFCNNLILKHNLSYNGNSISVIDLTQVDRLLNNWKVQMPLIIPYYAIKANPDTEIIKRLNYFDCASSGEFQQVLSLGKNPKNIIYANTAKRHVSIIEAKKQGIEIFTADSTMEIDKIINLYSDCKIVLRICPDDSDALNTKFSSKFGILKKEDLYECIDKYIKNISGFSFHIGSGQKNVNAWANALYIIDDAFEYIRTKYKNEYDKVNIIDIGGGFTTDVSFSLSNIYTTLSTFIDKYNEKKWIAECGRYFCRDTSTLLCPIISKNLRQDGIYYVIGNSIYHSFNCIIWDKQIPFLQINNDDTKEYEFATIVGESCDGIDIIYQGKLPKNMEIGDILIIPNMGAYSEAVSTNFNGFPPAQKEYYYD